MIRLCKTCILPLDTQGQKNKLWDKRMIIITVRKYGYGALYKNGKCLYQGSMEIYRLKNVCEYHKIDMDEIVYKELYGKDLELFAGDLPVYISMLNNNYDGG